MHISYNNARQGNYRHGIFILWCRKNAFFIIIMTAHTAYCNCEKFEHGICSISNGSRKTCFKLAVWLSILPLQIKYPLSEWYTVQHRSTLVQWSTNVEHCCDLLKRCCNLLNAHSTFVEQQLHILVRSWNGGRGNVVVALYFERCRRCYEASTKKTKKPQNLDARMVKK